MTEPTFYPDDAVVFAKAAMKAARAGCPKCGAKGRAIVLAKQHNGVLLEGAI